MISYTADNADRRLKVGPGKVFLPRPALEIKI